MAETYLTQKGLRAKGESDTHAEVDLKAESELFKQWYQVRSLPFDEGRLQRGVLPDIGQKRKVEEVDNDMSGARLRRLDKISCSPCQLCGSREHPMFNRSPSETDLLYCPVAWHDEWRAEPGPRDLPPSEVHEISRYKLAEYINYDPRRIRQTIEDYHRYGVGQSKSLGNLRLMEDSLHHICEEHQVRLEISSKSTKGGGGSIPSDTS